MNTEFLTQRTHLMHQMASLQSMEPGSLKAEYRASPADGQTGQVGPYYKHQVWQNGRNVSRRISAEEAPGLQTAIANRQRFEALAAQFVELTVAHTRQCQSATAQKKERPLPPCAGRGNRAIDGPILRPGADRGRGSTTGGAGAHCCFQV